MTEIESTEPKMIGAEELQVISWSPGSPAYPEPATEVRLQLRVPTLDGYVVASLKTREIVNAVVEMLVNERDFVFPIVPTRDFSDKELEMVSAIRERVLKATMPMEFFVSLSGQLVANWPGRKWDDAEVTKADVEFHDNAAGDVLFLLGLIGRGVEGKPDGK